MHSFIDRAAYGAKPLLYLFAAALPVFVLPPPLGAGIGREAVFTSLILIAAMLWLVSALANGEIRWSHSPALWAGCLWLAISLLSAGLTQKPIASLLTGDVLAERVSWLVLGLALMVVSGAVLRRREEAGTAMFIMIVAAAISAALTAGQLLLDISLFRYFDISRSADANVIGTINGLALFYAVFFMMALGLLVSPSSHPWKSGARRALALCLTLFALDLLLINFRTSWIAILVSSALFFGLLVTNMSIYRNIDISRRFGWRQWILMAVIAGAAVMIATRGPVFKDFKFTAEISPSWGATFSIAQSVFKEGPGRVFFGSGPGTFGLDWARYKDISINQTIFWGTRFTQGQSWAATLLATTGILGFAAFLGLIAAMLFIFLRALMRSGEADVLGMSGFLGMAPIFTAAFLYPANPWLILVLFFLAGLCALVIRSPLPVFGHATDMKDTTDIMETDGACAPAADEEADEEFFAPEQIRSGEGAFSPHHTPEAYDAATRTPATFWDIRERRISLNAPWSVFVSSLAVMLLVVLGAVGVYAQTLRVRAAWRAEDGRVSAEKGDIAGALAGFGAAADLQPQDFGVQQAVAQIRTEAVRRIIQRAVGGENVQQEFQAAVSIAIQEAQRLTDMFGPESGAWRVQGALYEMLIPYIQGSERFAVAAYQKASEREPGNPAIYTEWGRAGLVFTDRIQTAIAQEKDEKNRQELSRARKENLEQIIQIFQKAMDLKPDFAPAHFLLAQTQIRLGNIDSAIRSVENAKLAAPFDIGVAFQLGLLYYQKENFDRAEQEFGRAVTINENYSNARYFLGLIYDRKGDRDKAVEQFAKIASLNPDNQEVRQILANLEAGREALAGIVPPAPPPEKRKEAPVGEREQRR